MTRRNGVLMRVRQAMAAAEPVKPPPTTHTVKGDFRINIPVRIPEIPTLLIYNVCGGNEAPRVAPMSAEAQSFSSKAKTGNRTGASASLPGWDYPLRPQISAVMLPPRGAGLHRVRLPFRLAMQTAGGWPRPTSLGRA